MKKYMYTCVCFLLFCLRAESQNLVPNPSFEDTIACPLFYGDVNSSIGWESYRESPDYFNSCNLSGLGVPVNARGSQFAFEGNAYMGIATFHPAILNLREFLGINLMQPLTPGLTYYISFYVSLADTFGADCPTNNIGIKFSMLPYSTSAPAPIDNYAVIKNDSILNNKISWTLIKGEFIPSQSFEHIIIGNFFDDSLTLHPPCIYYGYYYVDNICVSLDSNDCYLFSDIQELNYNEIKIYPTITTDYILIESLEKITSLELINAYGTKFPFTYESSFSLLKINLEGCPSGIYYLKIVIKNMEIFKKFIVLK